MGIENMRRWQMCIILTTCIFLTITLFNSWGMETELQNRISEISTQLQECSRQHTSCMEESLRYLQQRDLYNTKVNDLESEKVKLSNDVANYKSRASKAETQANRSSTNVELCKAELQSLKNLQVSKYATLETLRLEKITLTTQLDERKQKIEELEKEITRLKSALTTKSVPNPPVSSKVTPAAQPPKLSPALNAHNQINDPVLENDAKEELEDPNALNDGNDFDQQIQ
ncbi:uncharacterized protein [Epargyreus clarus]|uniref:uncharacterized protein n=1 Tax=Epargyreus clarus TaxID=520877 RepID=UPI003C2AD5CB